MDPLFQKKNINDVIRETLNSLVRPENVNITWELNPDLPEVDIDEEQIRIVFRNLIINSFKAMIRTGDLRISTSKEDHIVRISFTDTGCGIEEERRKGIFDHLFTIEKDIKGFGLSISKLVIEKHKGSIGFESEIGKGTTFVIKLPVEQK
jgi:signal transduction histidine kinase